MGKGLFGMVEARPGVLSVLPLSGKDKDTEGTWGLSSGEGQHHVNFS